MNDINLLKSIENSEKVIGSDIQGLSHGLIFVTDHNYYYSDFIKPTHNDKYIVHCRTVYNIFLEIIEEKSFIKVISLETLKVISEMIIGIDFDSLKLYSERNIHVLCGTEFNDNSFVFIIPSLKPTKFQPNFNPICDKKILENGYIEHIITDEYYKIIPQENTINPIKTIKTIKYEKAKDIFEVLDDDGNNDNDPKHISGDGTKVIINSNIVDLETKEIKEDKRFARDSQIFVEINETKYLIVVFNGSVYLYDYETFEYINQLKIKIEGKITSLTYCKFDNPTEEIRIADNIRYYMDLPKYHLTSSRMIRPNKSYRMVMVVDNKVSLIDLHENQYIQEMYLLSKKAKGQFLNEDGEFEPCESEYISQAYWINDILIVVTNCNYEFYKLEQI